MVDGRAARSAPTGWAVFIHIQYIVYDLLILNCQYNLKNITYFIFLKIETNDVKLYIL